MKRERQKDEERKLRSKVLSVSPAKGLVWGSSWMTANGKNSTS